MTDELINILNLKSININKDLSFAIKMSNKNKFIILRINICIIYAASNI